MIRGLVERVYAALAAGDRGGLLAVLTDDFEARFADGLPHGLGGRRAGAVAAIDHGWWAIGARFALRAEPEEWIDCADGRLLVLGTYRGRARTGGQAVEAAFDHLWAARDDRLCGLRQLTDTVRWPA